MDRSLFEQDKLDKRRNKKDQSPNWKKKWNGISEEIKPGKFVNDRIKRRTKDRAEASKKSKDQHTIVVRIKELEGLRSECLEAIKSHV